MIIYLCFFKLAYLDFLTLQLQSSRVGIFSLIARQSTCPCFLLCTPRNPRLFTSSSLPLFQNAEASYDFSSNDPFPYPRYTDDWFNRWVGSLCWILSNKGAAKMTANNVMVNKHPNIVRPPGRGKLRGWKLQGRGQINSLLSPNTDQCFPKYKKNIFPNEKSLWNLMKMIRYKLSKMGPNPCRLCFQTLLWLIKGDRYLVCYSLSSLTS